MADLRIYDLPVTTDLTGKVMMVDAVGQTSAQQYDVSGLSGNFVDLTTNQTAAGEKTWSDDAFFNGEVTGSRDFISKFDGGFFQVQKTDGTIVAYLGHNTGLGGFFQANDDTATPQAIMRGYATGGVQGYFLIGNVGFGTSAPSEMVTIQTPVSSTGLRHEDAGGNDRIHTFIDASGNGGLTIVDSTNTIDIVLQAASNSYFLTGNVGIGTAAPDTELEVFSFGVTELRLRCPDTGSVKISFADSTGALGIIEYSTNINEMYFYTDTNLAMVIDASGNIGIGTPTPAYILDIYNAGDEFLYLDSAGHLRLPSPTGQAYVYVGTDKTPQNNYFFRGVGDGSSSFSMVELWNTKASAVDDFSFLNFVVRTTTQVQTGTVLRFGGYVEATGVNGTDIQGGLQVWTNPGAATLQNSLQVSGDGTLTLAKYAGGGTRTLQVDNNGVVSAV